MEQGIVLRTLFDGKRTVHVHIWLRAIKALARQRVMMCMVCRLR